MKKAWKGKSGTTPLGTLMLNKNYGEKYIDNFLLSYPSVGISDAIDDELGVTPLHVFAMKEMTSSLQKWLSIHPSLVDIRDKYRHTPLHYAVLQLQYSYSNSILEYWFSSY